MTQTEYLIETYEHGDWHPFPFTVNDLKLADDTIELEDVQWFAAAAIEPRIPYRIVNGPELVWMIGENGDGCDSVGRNEREDGDLCRCDMCRGDMIDAAQLARAESRDL